MSNNNHTKELSSEERKLRKREYIRTYEQRDDVKKKRKAYLESKKEQIKQYHKDRYQNNKEKFRAQAAAYFQKNKERYKEKVKEVWRPRELERNKIKRQTDLHYQMKIRLSDRISKAFKNVKASKHFKTKELLGCTVQEAKAYIESKWLPGMSWDNYGIYGWHIDHIKPVSSFDLTDSDQQRQCFHYTNLQPLWAKDNLIKNARLDWKDQSSALQQDPQ
jgi:hypothetical protein